MKNTKRHSDPFTDSLEVINRWAVRALAILMTVVIVLGVVDVAWQLHQKAMARRGWLWAKEAGNE